MAALIRIHRAIVATFARSQFLCHHADRARAFPGAASILKRSVAAEFKFEIGGHDVAVGQRLEHVSRHRATV